MGFGPDSIFGDHVGLHHAYAANLSIQESHGGKRGAEGMEYEEVEYVKGIENPSEGSVNILRWLVKHGYPDEEIRKVMGGNALRLLREVWE